MRPRMNTQSELNFQPSNLEITNQYYRKYDAISSILDDNPGIVDAIHRELVQALEEAAVEDRHGAKFKYTSDTILRIVLCQIIEGCSLREIVIRIDDSNFLRSFVSICNGPMIDFTTFCRLKNLIGPETWKQVNELLARAAVKGGLIDGEQLRLDTTAVETNIHWPTDSSLLWDTYRTLARLLERIREIDPVLVGDQRLLIKKVKRLQQKIARKATKHPSAGPTLEPLYIQLIRLVERICEWSGDIGTALAGNLARHRYPTLDQATMEFLLQQIIHYGVLGEQVIDQACRRIVDKEKVPNKEKIFSIFEPHTELLKRGKAAKPIEFGHMIQIGQVDGKFITDYDVFEAKPVEYELIGPALEHHKRLFGTYPDKVAADKGYYESMKQIDHLGKKIEVVAIAKKGKRTEEQTLRETDPAFRHAQRFRAGVEGTISFLKRVLGLFRCYNKGWEHYTATVGATILAHNLLLLARC
ncbi:MAG: ISNCY family transposase [Planctomycetes bacterium]|nr:ISNCY family transposase [Planctomycetota bacterium]